MAISSHEFVDALVPLRAELVVEQAATFRPDQRDDLVATLSDWLESGDLTYAPLARALVLPHGAAAVNPNTMTAPDFNALLTELIASQQLTLDDYTNYGDVNHVQRSLLASGFVIDALLGRGSRATITSLLTWGGMRAVTGELMAAAERMIADDPLLWRAFTTSIARIRVEPVDAGPSTARIFVRHLYPLLEALGARQTPPQFQDLYELDGYEEVAFSQGMIHDFGDYLRTDFATTGVDTTGRLSEFVTDYVADRSYEALR